MFIIRLATLSDLDVLEEFAYASSIGITNLPKNRALLKKKLEDRENLHLFMLDEVGKKPVGTCAIFEKTGILHPSYFYRVEEGRHTILHPTTRIKGPSETCGLYLHPDYRKEGLGKLLSLSRFLFIAENRPLFCDTIITELRGIIRKNGTSPFWDGVGRFFCDCKFTDALQRFEQDPQFPLEIMPEYPLYADLIKAQARLAVGKVHPHTKPALKLLKREGFSLSNEIDLMDGGPHLIAQTEKIRTIKDSKRVEVKRIKDCHSKKMLIAACEGPFRVCIGNVLRGSVDPETAVTLDLQVGDTVRTAPLQVWRRSK